METLQEILKMIIYAVITGCGVAIVQKILQVINKEIDELQANTQLSEYQKLNSIIDHVQEMIFNVVTTTNQVFVDALKKENKFDKDAAAKAKDMAVEKCKEMLTEDGIKAINILHGNIDVFLDTTIESTVNQLKK